VTEDCTSIGLPSCSLQFLVHRGYCIVVLAVALSCGCSLKHVRDYLVALLS
jgi:hypothetical protein